MFPSGAAKTETGVPSLTDVCEICAFHIECTPVRAAEDTGSKNISTTEHRFTAYRINCDN